MVVIYKCLCSLFDDWSHMYLRRVQISVFAGALTSYLEQHQHIPRCEEGSEKYLHFLGDKVSTKIQGIRSANKACLRRIFCGRAAQMK